MMKDMTLGIGLLVAGLLAVSSVQAEHPRGEHAQDKSAEKNEPKPAQAPDKAITLQTTCPVMGGKIDKKQYVDVAGKRIYVCCPGCIGKIKGDPAKYIKKLEKAGVTLDTPPEKPEKAPEAHKGHDNH